MVYSSFFIVSGGLKAKLALAQRKKALGREQNVDLTLGQHMGAVIVLPIWHTVPFTQNTVATSQS